MTAWEPVFKLAPYCRCIGQLKHSYTHCRYGQSETFIHHCRYGQSETFIHHCCVSAVRNNDTRKTCPGKLFFAYLLLPTHGIFLIPAESLEHLHLYHGIVLIHGSVQCRLAFCFGLDINHSVSMSYIGYTISS